MMQFLRRKKVVQRGIAALVLACILGFGLFQYSQQTRAAWYNDAWAYRTKLTIDHTKVGADQTDFPVYIDLSILSSEFHQHVNQTDARDIRITKGDGTTELPREVVGYNKSTKTGEVHFKYTGTLSSTTDTDVYIYYGNATAADYAAAATYGKNNVWDSNYKGVWHLTETSMGTADEMKDSTSTGNHLKGDSTASKRPGVVAAKLYNGQSFVTVNSQYLQRTSAVSLGTLVASQSMEAWYKVEANPTTTQNIVCTEDSTYSHHNCIYIDGAAGKIGVGTTWDTPFTQWIQTNVPAAGSWHHVIWTWDGTTNRLYIDGTEATNNTTTPYRSNAVVHMWIGNDRSGVSTSGLDGQIDEARFTSTNRSATWISTQYKNQNDASSFFKHISAEENTRQPVLFFAFNEGYGSIANSQVKSTVPKVSAPWIGNSNWLEAATGSSLSFSHSIEAGTNMLVVAAGSSHNTDANVSAVTSVSFSGLALTKVREDYNSDDHIRVSYWYLLNPPNTTGNVAISYTGSSDRGIIGASFSIHEAAAAAPEANVGTNSGSGGAISQSITTLTDNSLVLDMIGASSGSDTLTIGSPAKQILNQGIEGNSMYGISSYTKTSAGSTTFNWTKSVTNRGYTWSMIAIKPAGNGATTVDGVLSGTKTGPTVGNTSQSNAATGSSLSFSHTVESGATMLLVAVGGSDSSSTDSTVTEVTYAGTPLVHIRHSYDYDNEIRVGLWYLPNPPVGAANIVTTFAGSNDHGIFAAGLSILNADTAQPEASTGKNAGAGGAISQSITTLTDNALVIDILGGSAGSETFTIGSPATQVYNQAPSSRFAVSKYSTTTAGSTTFNWTKSSSARGYAWSMVSIQRPRTLFTSSTIPTWQKEDTCVAGNCLYFNGTTSHIKTSLADYRNEDSEGTISMWVKPLLYTNSPALFVSGDEGSATRLLGTALTSTGQVSIFQQNGDTLDGIATTNTIPLNTWSHLEFVSTGATWKIYVNGALQSTSVLSGSNSGDWFADTSARDNITLGVLNINGSYYDYYFKGYMDEVKIYPKARTDSEVKSDYSRWAGSAGSSAVLSSRNASNTGPLSNGLVAYLKMDDNTGTSATDATGNSNTGTLTNSPTWVAGKYGSGIYFDPATSNKAVVVNPATSIDNLGAFTWSLWVKPSQLQAHSILQKGGNLSLYFDNISSGLRTQFYMGCSGAGMDRFTTSADNMSVNTWHHIAVTWDGKDCKVANTSVYIDGVLTSVHANSHDGSGARVNDTGIDMRIGNTSSLTDQLQGTVDEVRVYNRAFTPSEVKQLVDFAPGPVAWWKMDENKGQLVRDSSGNGFDFDSGTGSWSQGKYGSGYTVTTGQILGSNDIGNNLDSVSQFSISFWAKINAHNDWGNNMAAKSQDSSTRILIQEGTLANLGRLYFDVSNGSTSDGYADNLFTIGQWAHISMVFNGSGATNAEKLKAYINGVQKTLTYEGTLPSSTANIPAQFKAIETGQATLDDMRIYNYVRSPSQIVEDMNAGHPAPGSPVGSASNHWKFDESYGTTSHNSGSVGTATDGTLSGSVKPVWTTGRFSRGLQFNGDSSYISVPDNNSLDFRTGPFTLTTWIKTTTTSSINDFIAFKGGGNATDVGYAWQVNRSSGLQMLNISDGSSYIVTNLTGTKVITDNQWHFLAMVWDPSVGAKLYVDNALDAQSAVTSTVDFNSSNAMTIGGWTSATYSLNGVLDEMKSYSYALSADQLKIEYNQGKAMTFGANSKDKEELANSTGILGYWRLNETSWTNDCSTSTVLDSTPNALNLKACPASTGPTGGASGKYENGGSFDGSNDYLESASTTLNVTGTITLAAWVKPGAVPAGDVMVIDRTNNNTGYSLGWSSTMKPRLRIGNGSTYVNVNGTTTLSTTGGWYHIVGTVDSAGQGKIYTDGVMETSTTTGPVRSETGQNFRIGTRSTGNYVTGGIDEVRVYNRALSDSEVQDLANWAPGPVGWWKLDDNTGTAANDTSGNGNTGTLTSSPTWVPGKVGSAVKFNGTTDYVLVPYNANLNPRTDITVSFWFKPAVTIDTSLNTYKGILSKASSNTDSDNDWVFFWESTENGRIRFGTYGDNVQTASNTWVAGRWYNLTATVSNTSTAYIYVNGIQDNYNSDTSVSANPINGTTNTPLNIGLAKVASGDQYFNGQIDDVKIYDYALTPKQVMSEYNRGAPTTWFKFDECGGSTVYDNAATSYGTATGFNGTITPGAGTYTTAGTCNSGSSSEMWNIGSSGKFGGSLAFDGTDDYVTMGSTTNTIEGATEATICAWIKYGPASVTTDGAIVSRYNGQYVGWLMWVDDSAAINGRTDTVSVAFQAEDSGFGRIEGSSGLVTPGVWDHYCGVFKGGTYIKLYKNAKLDQQNTSNIVSTVNATSNVFYIGRVDNASPRNFQGQIDDVRLYRYALSPQEIQTVYSNGSTVRFSP
jgi:hypothetical protein